MLVRVKGLGQISTFILWQADRRTHTHPCRSLLGTGEGLQSGNQFTPYVGKRLYLRGEKQLCIRLKQAITHSALIPFILR